MKIQVNFNYKGVNYQFTINDRNIDYKHYEDMWDYWCGENANELNGIGYEFKNEENELVFEFTGAKHFLKRPNGGVKEVISGENMYINVYKNNFEDGWCDQIENDNIEVRYA